MLSDPSNMLSPLPLGKFTCRDHSSLCAGLFFKFQKLAGRIEILAPSFPFLYRNIRRCYLCISCGDINDGESGILPADHHVYRDAPIKVFG